MPPDSKPIVYLKVRLEAFTFDERYPEGGLYNIQKLYPLDHMDDSYRTYMVYEILDQLAELRNYVRTVV